MPHGRPPHLPRQRGYHYRWYRWSKGGGTTGTSKNGITLTRASGYNLTEGTHPHLHAPVIVRLIVIVVPNAKPDCVSPVVLQARC